MGDNQNSITARVTYLEMETRHAMNIPRPSRPPLALLRASNIPPAFYRYLYEQVGRDHHWYLRRVLDDDTLSQTINSEDTQIDILYAEGCPAGFFELDLRALPDKVEIAYFGLCRDYTGLGIGKWFLSCAVEAAWDHGPVKLAVHTNTLDHPRALPLYQRLGFTPVGVGEETVEPWPA